MKTRLRSVFVGPLLEKGMWQCQHQKSSYSSSKAVQNNKGSHETNSSWSCSLSLEQSRSHPQKYIVFNNFRRINGNTLHHLLQFLFPCASLWICVQSPPVSVLILQGLHDSWIFNQGGSEEEWEGNFTPAARAGKCYFIRGSLVYQWSYNKNQCSAAEVRWLKHMFISTRVNKQWQVKDNGDFFFLVFILGQ